MTRDFAMPVKIEEFKTPKFIRKTSREEPSKLVKTQETSLQIPISPKSIERAKPHMIRALKTNNSDLVRKLLNSGMPANTKLEGVPMLIFAVMHGVGLTVFNTIIKSGANLESTAASGSTVCHWACHLGRLDLLKFLVPKLRQLGLAHLWSKRTINGLTPALTAIQNEGASKCFI